MNQSHVRVHLLESGNRLVLRSDIQELEYEVITIRGVQHAISHSETYRLSDVLAGREGINQMQTLTQYEFETIYEFMCSDDRRYYTRGSNGPMDNVYLSDMDFSGMDLHRLDLRDSQVNDCNFTGANLSWATLGGTRFYNCRFEGAIMNGVKMASARVNHSTFFGVSLRDYPDLEGVDWEDSKGITALYLPGLSSRSQSLFMVHPIHEDGPVMFQAGCQFLTLGDFLARVDERKADRKDHPYVKVATLLAELNLLGDYDDRDAYSSDDYDDDDYDEDDE